MQRLSGFAWVIVLVLAWVLGIPSDWLGDAIGDGRTACLYFLLGIPLGVLWYVLRPRPFAERVFGWAALFTFLALVAFIPGFSVEVRTPAGAVGAGTLPFGIVAGLVFAERRALARREPARELPRRDVAA